MTTPIRPSLSQALQAASRMPAHATPSKVETPQTPAIPDKNKLFQALMARREPAPANFKREDIEVATKTPASTAKENGAPDQPYRRPGSLLNIRV